MRELCEHELASRRDQIYCLHTFPQVFKEATPQILARTIKGKELTVKYLLRFLAPHPLVRLKTHILTCGPAVLLTAEA